VAAFFELFDPFLEGEVDAEDDQRRRPRSTTGAGRRLFRKFMSRSSN